MGIGVQVNTIIAAPSRHDSGVAAASAALISSGFRRMDVAMKKNDACSSERPRGERAPAPRIFGAAGKEARTGRHWTFFYPCRHAGSYFCPKDLWTVFQI
jgi:hypothetical protein